MFVVAQIMLIRKKYDCATKQVAHIIANVFEERNFIGLGKNVI